MLDYWGLSLKQASQGLLEKHGDMRERPAGALEDCRMRSPSLAVVELGSDFAITWDAQGADFAMLLGEFYCRKFDAPLLVEVMRAGVVYARVYDIRGRSYETLLTLPGL
jgi:hypothetical protein